MGRTASSSTPRSRSHAATGPSRSRIASSIRASARGEPIASSGGGAASPRSRPRGTRAASRPRPAIRGARRRRAGAGCRAGDAPARRSRRRAASPPAATPRARPAPRRSTGAAALGVVSPIPTVRTTSARARSRKLEGRARRDLGLAGQRDQQVLGPDVRVPHHPRLLERDDDDLRAPLGEALEHGRFRRADGTPSGTAGS